MWNIYQVYPIYFSQLFYPLNEFQWIAISITTIITVPRKGLYDWLSLHHQRVTASKMMLDQQLR